MSKVTVLNNGQNNFMIDDVILEATKTAKIDEETAKALVAKYPNTLQIVEAEKAEVKKEKAEKAEVSK